MNVHPNSTAGLLRAALDKVTAQRDDWRARALAAEAKLADLTRRGKLPGQDIEGLR